MTTSRFDPKEDTHYGTCKTCKLGLPTKTHAVEHTTATLEAARRAAKNETDRVSSHSIAVTNPPRENRIHSEIESLVAAAVQDVIDDVDQLVENGDLTREEATAAIRHWDDFAEGWADAGYDEVTDSTSTTAVHASASSKEQEVTP